MEYSLKQQQQQKGLFQDRQMVKQSSKASNAHNTQPNEHNTDCQAQSS